MNVLSCQYNTIVKMPSSLLKNDQRKKMLRNKLLHRTLKSDKKYNLYEDGVTPQEHSVTPGPTFVRGWGHPMRA